MAGVSRQAGEPSGLEQGCIERLKQRGEIVEFSQRRGTHITHERLLIVQPRLAYRQLQFAVRPGPCTANGRRSAAGRDLKRRQVRRLATREANLAIQQPPKSPLDLQRERPRPRQLQSVNRGNENGSIYG